MGVAHRTAVIERSAGRVSCRVFLDGGLAFRARDLNGNRERVRVRTTSSITVDAKARVPNPADEMESIHDSPDSRFQSRGFEERKGKGLRKPRSRVSLPTSFEAAAHLLRPTCSHDLGQAR